MKYLYVTIVFVLLLIYGTVSAQSVVSEKDAESAAIAVATNQQNNGIIRTVKKKTDSSNHPLLYEVIMEDSSAVLLSGNKACTPILGEYKYCGISIVDDFEMIPCGLKCLVNNYVNQISQCYESDNHLDDNSRWNSIINGVDTMFVNRSSVAPLLHSKWGQNKSNDGLDNTAYNEFAPDSGCTYGSSHCPAGCVAVAMGQIMYYWKYPFFISKDNDIFNWCNMSDELRVSNPCYEYNKKAINSILKACGKSVNMIYHCSGSGSDLLDAKDALKYVFGYKSGIASYYFWNNNYNITTLGNRIVDELDKGRPVLMRAVDHNQGGHAFVCDGYSRNGKVHINWGWTGNFDGYYQIDILNPDCYSLSQQYGIIYKITPDIVYQNQSIVNLDIFYSDYLSNNYYPYRLVPEQSDILQSASVNSPSEWRTIPANATSIYQAHNEIILHPGFTAEYGSNFTARIEPYAACEERMVQMEMLTGGESDNIENITDTSGYEMRVFKSGDTVILSQPSSLLLYPNPTDNTVTVRSPEKIENILILDNVGRPIFRWFIESNADGLLTLNVGNIPNGVYILQLTTANKKTHIGRFIKN